MHRRKVYKFFTGQYLSLKHVIDPIRPSVRVHNVLTKGGVEIQLRLVLISTGQWSASCSGRFNLQEETQVRSEGKVSLAPQAIWRSLSCIGNRSLSACITASWLLAPYGVFVCQHQRLPTWRVSVAVLLPLYVTASSSLSSCQISLIYSFRVWRVTVAHHHTQWHTHTIGRTPLDEGSYCSNVAVLIFSNFLQFSRFSERL